MSTSPRDAPRRSLRLVSQPHYTYSDADNEADLSSSDSEYEDYDAQDSDSDVDFVEPGARNSVSLLNRPAVAVNYAPLIVPGVLGRGCGRWTSRCRRSARKAGNERR